MKITRHTTWETIEIEYASGAEFLEDMMVKVAAGYTAQLSSAKIPSALQMKVVYQKETNLVRPTK